MKNLVTIVLTLFFASTAAFSQNDEKARKILDEIGNKYRNYKTIKADFRYKLEMRADDFVEEQKGTVWLKDDKFRLEFNNQEIISDNSNIWVYLKDINEVQINTYSPDEIGINPRELFMMYDEGFLYKFVEEKNENGRTLQIIELTPTDKEKSYFKVILAIDKAKEQLVRTQIYEKNGNIYTYEILDMKGNVDLKDSFFQFNKNNYPGVIVVDTR